MSLSALLAEQCLKSTLPGAQDGSEPEEQGFIAALAARSIHVVSAHPSLDIAHVMLNRPELPTEITSVGIGAGAMLNRANMAGFTMVPVPGNSMGVWPGDFSELWPRDFSSGATALATLVSDAYPTVTMNQLSTGPDLYLCPGIEQSRSTGHTYLCFGVTSGDTGSDVVENWMSTPTVRDDPLLGYDRYENPNWDGLEAAPISRATLKLARQLLNVMPKTFGPPDVAPSADGSIGLEWVPDFGPLKKLFIDIGPGEEWWSYWTRRNGEFGRLPGKLFTRETPRILKSLFDDLST